MANASDLARPLGVYAGVGSNVFPVPQEPTAKDPRTKRLLTHGVDDPTT